MLVILDDSVGRRVFAAPRAVIRADSADQVPGALKALEAARGHWLAGSFAYELGYALESRLARRTPADGPLLQFGVYDAPTEAPPSGGRAYAGPLKPEWDEAAYTQRFAKVKEAIAAGDIYQANLSFRAGFAFAGSPRALYEQLRASSAAPHCAFVDDGVRQVVSLSPELFFEIENDEIRARPMKGTSAKGSGGARAKDDAAERAALGYSEKNRAENLMIVDLIRNDLGRIAQTGSVKVSDLYRIETYPSLHTMVSGVTATLKPKLTIAQIVAALLPCGSITGAPKIRAMEILHELESSRRGDYCGAIGFFAPDGSARFNVAIRTLSLDGNRGTLGIGGGVVQDSRAKDEYAECLLKARFFTGQRRPLTLIETLRYDGYYVRLARHLSRMAASARHFGIAFDEAAALAALESVVGEGPLRVRLTLDEAGQFTATAAALPPNPPHWTYTIAPDRLDSADTLLHHKTDWRELYERKHDGDEVIFLNTQGEVCEGARSNIFVRQGHMLLTPPLSSGLLLGVLRAELLHSGQCVEQVLTQEDLKGEVLFGNSLRGLIPGRSV